MLRVMVDTNVIISGIVFFGNERKLLNAIYINQATLLLTEYIEKETRIVFDEKFPGREKVFSSLIDLLNVERTPLPPKQLVEEAKLIIRDPKDAIILASAIISKPDLFVSGDLDFHTSKVKVWVHTVHTKEALALIKQK